MENIVTSEEMYRIIYQDHYDPFQVLGPHKAQWQGKSVVVIRCFFPNMREVRILSLADKKEYPMQKLHTAGFYEAICEDKSEIFPYQVKIVEEGGGVRLFYDAYAFPASGLTEFDLYLLQQGKHYDSFEKLGSHVVVRDGVTGVYFAVWAPNARAVSVIGCFNNWDRRYHMMRLLGSSGIWEIFIPELHIGSNYKYQMITYQNYIADKADPYSFFSELSPHTASVIYDLNQYQWNDQNWMTARVKTQSLQSPISIYEVHLGSWRRDSGKPGQLLDYRRLAHELVAYVQEMGYTHIELMPVSEHPFYGSWGYQVVSYYAPTSRYGTPDDFMYFVDYCHQHGIGVLLDWVAAHFPRDGHGLAFFDGTHLYEHADARQRDNKDWNTFVYNYGRFEVKNFLLSNAVFWLKKYHIDGLRVDAVASMLYLDYSRPQGEWLPNKYGGRENLDAIAFLQELNTRVQQDFPGVLMIAEESTAWPKVSGPAYLGGLGFTCKWNMGWMNDMLRYMSMDPVFRKYHHQTLAFSIWYAWSENFILPLSHDEVVYGKRSLLDKMPGDVWKKFANLRLLYGYMFAHPGKKMLFMGGEFGQWREWNHDQGLDWQLLRYKEHQELKTYVRELNLLYRAHPAFYECDTGSQGFAWVDFKDADHSVIAFWRKGTKEQLMFVFNFTPVPQLNYQLGVEKRGRYLEIFNSDAGWFGGSNVGNSGEAWLQPQPWHDKPYTLNLTLPPLAMVVFSLIEPENTKTV